MVVYGLVTAPSEPAQLDGGGLPELADDELVQRIAARREDALSELYDRYSSMLLGLARQVVGRTADAEEVLQEVFVQVWDQAHRYDRRRASVSTWLVMITRSRAIDLVRHRNVVDRTIQGAHEEKGPPHASPEGARAVLHTERRRRVRETLASIPEEQREVLELAFFEGLTQRQIAERTATPLGTVKTRSLLGMKKMRQALNDEIEDLL